MKTHTGGTLSLGKGSIYATLTKQKINTKSSTDAELVAVDDLMPQILWTRLFLESQGMMVKDNIVHQDNMSAIKLEKYGRGSSGKRTRHLNIRYFFITNRIKKGDVRIIHCPTDMLIADFYTKPLQGKQFRIFRNLLLNLQEPTCVNYTKAKELEQKQPIQHILTSKKKCENYVKLQECVENKMKRTYKDSVCSGLQVTTKAKNIQKPTKYIRSKLNVTGVLKPSKYSNYGHKLKK